MRCACIRRLRLPGAWDDRGRCGHLWPPTLRCPKKWERAPSEPGTLSRKWSAVSGLEHLRGQIPELAVELDVTPDGANPARAGQTTAGRAPAQAPTEQVLLAAVINPPEVIADVFRAPAGEELQGLHAALCRVRKAQRERPRGKAQLLVLEQPPLLHALDLGGQALEPLRELKCAGNHVVHDVPAMGHAVRRKRPPGDDQPVRAHDP